MRYYIPLFLGQRQYIHQSVLRGLHVGHQILILVERCPYLLLLGRFSTFRKKSLSWLTLDLNGHFGNLPFKLIAGLPCGVLKMQQ